MGRVENVEGLAAEIGCSVGSSPSTYWAFLLGPLTILWGLRISSRKGFVKDWPLGGGGIFPRVGELV